MSGNILSDQSAWIPPKKRHARRRLSTGDGQPDDNHSVAAEDTSKLPKSDDVRPKISVIHHITSELTRGYLLERDETSYTERRRRIYTFLRAPRELEKTLTYGLFQCVDAFLFLFTFLPIRVVLAMVRMFTHPCGLLSNRSGKFLEPSQIVDLMKAVIIISCIYIYNKVDTSMIYHMVRGQAIIKLYVFYNMLEVCDRLASGFGQDALDALFWTATEPNIRKQNTIEVILHFILVIAYVCIHTGMIMCQITVLNVAFNSHSKALLTIMMSNNFVEIKGNLFKRVDKSILFQISCSDVKERFHYYLLLSCVFMQNMTEFSWNPDHIGAILPDAVLVLIVEYIVDWVKHAFIAKFNEIPPEAYAELSMTMARDMVNSRQKQAFMDHSDLLSRRIGFTPIPLAVILVKVCMKSFKVHGWMGLCILGVFWMCLTTLKILSSIVLLGIAAQMLTKDKANVGDSTQLDSQVYSHKKPKPAETMKNSVPRGASGERLVTETPKTDVPPRASSSPAPFSSPDSSQERTASFLENPLLLQPNTNSSHVRTQSAPSYVSSAHIQISPSSPSEVTSCDFHVAEEPSVSSASLSDLHFVDASASEVERVAEADDAVPPAPGEVPSCELVLEAGESSRAPGQGASGKEWWEGDSASAVREDTSMDSILTPSFRSFSSEVPSLDGSDVTEESGANGGDDAHDGKKTK